jgi:hypothetical protein
MLRRREPDRGDWFQLDASVQRHTFMRFLCHLLSDYIIRQSTHVVDDRHIVSYIRSLLWITAHDLGEVAKYGE